MAKRYVLLRAEVELHEEEAHRIEKFLSENYGKVKVIPVEGNTRAVIVKTSNLIAPSLRGKVETGEKGRTLTSILVSGSIGKLKKRAQAGKDEW